MQQGAISGQHRMRLLSRPVLTYLFLSALVLAYEQADAVRSEQDHAGAAWKWLNATEQLQEHIPARRLLQSSYVTTACDSTAALSSTAVQDFASKLLGDSRLQLIAARFTGACSALGIAAFSSTNSLAQQFSTALVLSTGNVTAVVGDISGSAVALSTNLNQPGDSSIGSYTYDAAILELDISIQPSSSSSSPGQLILGYAFASEEYGLPNANPDASVIAIRPTNSSGLSSSSSLQQYTDLAVLPGGTHLPPPGAAAAASVPIDVFYNIGYQFNTAWRGFSQVVPSQGFTVNSGSSYTLRLEVADANNGLVDSALLFPVGSLKLHGAPTAAAGGPYAVAPNGQINLSASKSTSPNGAIMSYFWRITPYGSSTPVITASNPVITVTAPPAGQYNVTLDIWDVVGGHDSQITALSVNESNVLDWWSETPVFATPSSMMPRPAAVIAVNGTTTDTVMVKARTDSSVMLVMDASQSSDQRGSQLAYAWSIAQTQPNVQQLAMRLPFAEPSKFIYGFDIGTYLISLSVTGPGGITSARTLVTVAANTPPTAAAGGPYTATVGVPVVVSGAQSSDADGDPLEYSWHLFNSGGTQIGSYSGQALSMTLNNIGTYTLRLTVTDGRGGTSSAVTQITSHAPAPPPVPPPPPPKTLPSPPPAQPLNPPIPPAPPVVTYTPTVIAAVPASPPPSNARMRNPDPEATYATQSTPANRASSAAAATGMAAGAAAPAPAPAPPMCLYSKDSGGTVSLWDSAYDTMDDYNQIDMSLFPSSYWALCSSHGGSGSSMGSDSSTMGGSSRAGSGSSTSSSIGGSSDTSGSRLAAPQSAASTAVITGPGNFTLSDGTATQVHLDATGSTAAAGRSIIAFSWVVKRKFDGAVITQVTGLNTPVWLGPGVYTAVLQTTDTSGQTATAHKDFSIGAAAATTPVISSPGSFVQNTDAGPLRVILSAAGSKPGPGVTITGYQWLVVRLPDVAALATVSGSNATVLLPVGSYRAYLAAFDSGGGNGTVTKDFVVGNKADNGVSAVITWPPELVQASSSLAATTVALDGTGSAGASSSENVTQYVWAVVNMATKTAAGNATGRLTTISLPPGKYQVGLLVMDAEGNTASARKNFAVGSSTGTINNPPVVTPGMSFNGTVGGSVQITGVTDPDGDNVTLSWALLDQSNGHTSTGNGAAVSLANLTAGPHLLLITADDGKGGEASGTASLTVLPKPGTTPSSTNRALGERLPGPGSTVKESIKKLPNVTLPQGAVMELDALSFDLLPAGAKLGSVVWELRVQGTEEGMATVYGHLGRFELSTVGLFDLSLQVHAASGKVYNSTASIRVLAPISPSSAVDTWTRFSGYCGPFTAKQYTNITISCPSLVADGAKGDLQYAWKLVTPAGLVKSKDGREVSFIGLSPGHYRVQVAVAVGAAPNSQNTAYLASTFLKVDKVSKLMLGMPGRLCAGQIVSLHSPPLIQAAPTEPDYQWRVVWEGSEKILGYTEVLRGSGSTFGFTLQPGNYSVVMTATMVGGAVVQGFGNITALPCIMCKNSTVVIDLPAHKCSADQLLAQQVLASPLPQGTNLDWQAGSISTPGQRQVSVVATAVTSGANSTCSATVQFRDVTPPAVELLSSGGKCLTPVNQRWMCWKPNQLVILSDNCQAVAPLAFMVKCGQGATQGNCLIKADGEACVKAITAGQQVQLQVLARDGFGNVAEAVEVPIVVRSLEDAAGASCSVAAFSSP